MSLFLIPRTKIKASSCPGSAETLPGFLTAFRVHVAGRPDRFISQNEKYPDSGKYKTVGSYLEYLCNAFAFYKIRRYDIHGKKYLSSSNKYYLCDHTFRYARLGTRNLDRGRMSLASNVLVFPEKRSSARE